MLESRELLRCVQRFLEREDRKEGKARMKLTYEEDCEQCKRYAGSILGSLEARELHLLGHQMQRIAIVMEADLQSMTPVKETRQE